MMQDTLIDKYLNNKQSELLDYALVLYRIYPSDEESIWQSEEQYKEIINNILKVYYQKYYLRSESELNTLNKDNYSEKEFKLALALAVIADSYDTKYSEIKDKYKKGLYDLTVIIYLITNISKEVTFFQESITINKIIDKLQEYFNVIGQDKVIQKNPFIINNLANKIKDDITLEKKFFEHLESKKSYNSFAKYDEQSYFVKFNYENDNLDRYKENDVLRVYDKYKIYQDYYSICYELASVTILKSFILGKKIPTLLIPIDGDYLTNNKNINLINKMFSNVFIKKQVKFSIFYSDYEKKYEKFNILKDLGFSSVLYMDRNQMILDYSNIKLDLTIYAKDKFLENNPKFLDFTTKENIPFYTVNKNIYISEQELLEACLKED